MPEDLPAILGGVAVRPQGPPDWPLDDSGVRRALEDAIKTRIWGKYHAAACEELRQGLANYLQCDHVMLCSSGTVAIELALRGMGVGEGDEVILAAYDFKGNFQDVLAVGARPVLVDVDPDNWNLDPVQLERAMTDSTAAIIVSHLHGGILPMHAVRAIADSHGVGVIEDACQMPGATIEGCPAGLSGEVGVFSFGGSKLLSAGRGGALFARGPDTIQRAGLYANRGNEAYPLTELQAALLIPQLERLDELNQRRAENAQLLRQMLTGCDGLTPFQNRNQNNRPAASQPGYYKLGIQYEPAAFDGLSRDVFALAIRSEGIALDKGFRSLHTIHSRRRFQAVGDLPHATDADRRVLTLHHPILLGDESDLTQSIDAVEKIRRHAKMIRDRFEH